MINGNINLLNEQYLFAKVGSMIGSASGVINLSIGDVKLPLPHKVVQAGEEAAAELSKAETFRGYPPYGGYDFFKAAVREYYFSRGIDVAEDEIFASDGIKSDLFLMLNALERGTVLLPEPCYPAYVEANVLRGNKIEYYSSFPPIKPADYIVICSPDNPTGRAMNREELALWVDYAIKNGAIILFDAAYEAFVTSGAPRSIFEIAGAETCAVELSSMSKTAGFTGIRCGYTVVPHKSGLNKAWARIKSCLSNGVSYISQRMAACALTSAIENIRANIRYYLNNAMVLTEALKGTEFVGGVDSPYIWLSCGDSYGEFHKLLEMYGLGVTPGVGFGEKGENHVRINSFCTYGEAVEAAKRLKRYVYYK